MNQTIHRNPPLKLTFSASKISIAEMNQPQPCFHMAGVFIEVEKILAKLFPKGWRSFRSSPTPHLTWCGIITLIRILRGSLSLLLATKSFVTWRLSFLVRLKRTFGTMGVCAGGCWLVITWQLMGGTFFVLNMLGTFTSV